MDNPYKIKGPALIAFSGGRSSGYMLYHILEAHGGQLPNSVVVSFQNTGREMPETLDFVEACSREWHVNIEWIEYDPSLSAKWKRVNHTTAARSGEPFTALIQKRKYLPNPVARFCTAELKVRTAKRFMMAQGFDHWTSVLGMRGDEPKRVLNALKPSRERWTNICPMATAGVTKQMVTEFWSRQPFDLKLPNAGGKTPLGNCDGCFMKSEATLAGFMRDYPDRAKWWVDLEESISTTKGKLAQFNPSWSLRSLLQTVQSQGDWIFDTRNNFFCESTHGGCTD